MYSKGENYAYLYRSDEDSFGMPILTLGTAAFDQKS